MGGENMNIFTQNELSLSHINNICYVAPGTGKAVHTNRAYHGIVFYPRESSVFCFDGGKTVKAEKGCILYLPKGSCYRVEKPDFSQGCYAINFDLSENISEQPFCVSLKNPDEMQRLFVTAEKLWRNPTTACRMKCRSIFYDILSRLCAEENEEYLPDKTKNKLRSAHEYIVSRYLEEDISVEKLASLCDMSSAYFRRIFMKVHGTSPVRYINNLRISHAKELIMSDMYTTAEISRLSGFNDDCYFRRVFKSITGMSPAEYRKLKRR